MTSLEEAGALLEVARLTAWLRAISALAGPDAIALVERAIESGTWPAVGDDDRSDGTGSRRTGGRCGC